MTHARRENLRLIRLEIERTESDGWIHPDRNRSRLLILRAAERDLARVRFDLRPSGKGVDRDGR